MNLKFVLILRLLSRMRYLAAYLLASLGGAEPSAASIKRILEAGGVDVDADRVDEVVKALAGKQPFAAFSFYMKVETFPHAIVLSLSSIAL